MIGNAFIHIQTVLTVQILAHMVLAQEQDGVSTVLLAVYCFTSLFIIGMLNCLRLFCEGKSLQITKGNYFWICSQGFQYLWTNTLKAEQTLDLLRTLIRSGRLQLTENHRAHCPPPCKTNAPHGFGRHALCNLIGGEQQLHSLGGTAHHRRGEGVGEEIWTWALSQQVDERLGANCVPTWKKHEHRERLSLFLLAL